VLVFQGFFGIIKIFQKKLDDFLIILQNVLKSVKKTEKLLTKILEIVKFIKNCKFYKNYCAGGTL